MPIDEDGDPKEPGGINGGFFQRGTDGLEETFSEINVPSIDEYLKKIVSAGGKLVKPKGPILDIAYFAIDRSGEMILPHFGQLISSLPSSFVKSIV